MMETAEKDNANNMNKLTSKIDKLRNSITKGFDLLKQVMTHQQPYYPVAQSLQPAHSSNYQYGHMQTIQPGTRPALQGMKGGNQFFYTITVPRKHRKQ